MWKKIKAWADQGGFFQTLSNSDPKGDAQIIQENTQLNTYEQRIYSNDRHLKAFNLRIFAAKRIGH